jgi:hypothetical protein
MNMEERVKVCRACHAMVGWFALFCETCGAKQESHGGPSPAGVATAAAAPPAADPAPGASLEDEVRAHLVAPATDARAVARDLFQTQLRLIHRHREGVEGLLRDADAMKKDLAAAGRASGRDQAQAMLDRLSEQMFEVEQRWGELQVAYNRDSEMIEEESREHMEAADFDAYLSPDENAKVESEYGALKDRFETIDATLRDVGRALSMARQEKGSRYLGAPSRAVAGRGVLLLVTAGLVAWSLYSSFFQHQEGPIQVATTLGPLLVGLGMWVVFGFSRRS